MEIQTKERLTGAIVLVVLVVALVPELLSGRKSDSAPTATSPGGGADAAPLRSYTIDLESSAAQPAPTQPAPTSEPAVAATLPVPDVVPAPAPTPAPRPMTVPTPAAPTQTPAVPTPTPAVPVRAKAGEFVVQIGTFSSRENADRLARQLSGKGYAAYVAPVKGGKRDLFRVRVGPSASRDAATSLAGRLKAAGHAGAVVPAG